MVSDTGRGGLPPRAEGYQRNPRFGLMVIVGAIGVLALVVVAVLFARSSPAVAKAEQQVRAVVIACSAPGCAIRRTAPEYFRAGDESRVPAVILGVEGLDLSDDFYEAAWYTHDGRRLNAVSGRTAEAFSQPIPAVRAGGAPRGRLTFVFAEERSGRYVEVLARSHVDVVYRL